jgi:hypothetical protein
MLPAPSTEASRDVRSDRSMSVAARSRRPSPASSRMPERICTVVRVDTARATTATRCARSSVAHVMRSPELTAVSI